MAYIQTLDQVGIAALQRADMLDNPFIAHDEAFAYVNASLAELYDLLIGAYGHEYYAKMEKGTLVPGQAMLPMPGDVYKILGVDLQINGYWQSLKPMNWGERARYANLLSQQYPLVYRIQGNNLLLLPEPQIACPASLSYIPSCPVLSDSVMSSEGTNPPHVSLTGKGVDPAMHVLIRIDVPGNLTVAKFSYSTDGGQNWSASAFTAATVVLGTSGYTAVFPAGSYSADNTYEQTNTFDFISGWHEYVIVDVAIKCLQKEESDVSALLMQKGALKQRIEAMAQNRDEGGPATVTDTQYGGGPGWGFWMG